MIAIAASVRMVDGGSLLPRPFDDQRGPGLEDPDGVVQRDRSAGCAAAVGLNATQTVDSSRRIG
jgi:hypothetical protein